jgi:hypothetical protein
MQPTYLPWVGYFDLIDQSDVFVFLDQVQFSHQSWQQRNRVRTPKGLEWLTVPVRAGGRQGQTVREAEIADPGFARKHLRAIEMNYRKAPCFERYFPEFRDILREAPGRLAELNRRLILWLASRMGVEADFRTSSEMGAEGRRSRLLVGLCRQVDSRRYLSPAGARDYLQEDRAVFRDAGIRVWLQQYEHPEYRQVYAPFLPQASALDLLFNEGENAAAIMRGGRRSPAPLDAEAL